MADKILGVACLALSAASQAFIRHHDTAMFYSVLFFALGAFEYLLGHWSLLRLPSDGSPANTASVRRDALS